jgi:hypothetical protein
MNILRRLAALKREIQYREEELERIARLRAAGDETILALPDFIEKYLADIRIGIAQRETEIRKLGAEN